MEDNKRIRKEGRANTKAPMIPPPVFPPRGEYEAAEDTHTGYIITKKQKQTCTFVSLQFDILKPWLDMKKLTLQGSWMTQDSILKPHSSIS